MLFSCSATDIQHKFIDVSLQAIESDLFPLSLGFRSQVLKLKFADPTADKHYLQPTLTLKNVMQTLEQRFKPTHVKIAHHAYIGETVSIIYAPFYIDKYLYDGVLNKPVTSNLPQGFDIHSFPDARPEWAIQFLPTLCPHCGWDMIGQKDSLVLSCENCCSVYQPKARGFSKLNTVHLRGNKASQRYMPFWRIKADISGMSLNTYADFIREANLTKTAPLGFSEAAFHFWSPAFKIRPQFLLRLSQTATVAQPVGTFSAGAPKGYLHPVNLPLKEALEILKLILGGIIKPRHKIVTKLTEIKIKPKSFILVYLPFVEKHHDLVQPELGMSINKNMLAHAKNL